MDGKLKKMARDMYGFVDKVARRGRRAAILFHYTRRKLQRKDEIRRI